MSEQTFVLSTVVTADPETVWARISTPKGINHELGPWLRMTMPSRFRALTAENVPIGERVFRSWILLFGVVPVDFDDLTIERLEPGRGFLERSRLASARVWVHERTLEALGDGCRVTDRISFLPRVKAAGRLQRALLLAVFRHRHRRLVEHFGGA